MKRNLLTGVLVLSLALCISPAFAADKPATPDPNEMMKKWMEYSNPGPVHQHLQALAGKWTTVTRMWMDPTAPPAESKGTAEYSSVLGGRWIQMKYTGEVMQQPFEGMGMVGYDNFNKTYVSSWSDNMSTSLMKLSGTANADGSVITFTGTMDEPMTGERNKPYREVMTMTGPDSFTMEMYDTISGKEVKVMEITHTRVK